MQVDLKALKMQVDLKTYYGTDSTFHKFTTMQKWVDSLSDKNFELLQECIEKRLMRGDPLEVTVAELSLFVGEDILTRQRIYANRTKAIKHYRKRTKASLSSSRLAFATAVRDYCTKEGQMRLAKTCNYIKKAIHPKK